MEPMYCHDPSSYQWSCTDTHREKKPHQAANHFLVFEEMKRNKKINENICNIKITPDLPQGDPVFCPALGWCFAYVYRDVQHLVFLSLFPIFIPHIQPLSLSVCVWVCMCDSVRPLICFILRWDANYVFFCSLLYSQCEFFFSSSFKLSASFGFILVFPPIAPLASSRENHFLTFYSFFIMRKKEPCLSGLRETTRFHNSFWMHFVTLNKVQTISFYTYS